MFWQTRSYLLFQTIVRQFFSTCSRRQESFWWFRFLLVFWMPLLKLYWWRVLSYKRFWGIWNFFVWIVFNKSFRFDDTCQSFTLSRIISTFLSTFSYCALMSFFFVAFSLLFAKRSFAFVSILVPKFYSFEANFYFFVYFFFLRFFELLFLSLSHCCLRSAASPLCQYSYQSSTLLRLISTFLSTFSFCAFLSFFFIAFSLLFAKRSFAFVSILIPKFYSFEANFYFFVYFFLLRFFVLLFYRFLAGVSEAQLRLCVNTCF